jgi:hypothetical protein
MRLQRELQNDWYLMCWCVLVPKSVVGYGFITVAIRARASRFNTTRLNDDDYIRGESAAVHKSRYVGPVGVGVSRPVGHEHMH